MVYYPKTHAEKNAITNPKIGDVISDGLEGYCRLYKYDLGVNIFGVVKPEQFRSLPDAEYFNNPAWWLLENRECDYNCYSNGQIVNNCSNTNKVVNNIKRGLGIDGVGDKVRSMIAGVGSGDKGSDQDGNGGSRNNPGGGLLGLGNLGIGGIFGRLDISNETIEKIKKALMYLVVLAIIIITFII